MNQKLRSVHVVMLLVVLLAMTTSAFAQEGEQLGEQGQSEVATRVFSFARQRNALKLWTREAIAAAEPIELPAQAGPGEPDQAALAQPEASGPAGFAPAGAPAPDADAVARNAFPLDWSIAEESDASQVTDPQVPAEVGVMGTNSIYSSYIVNQISAMQTMLPHRQIGRITFTTPSGPSSCSGTSISGNVMLTAAHCLFDSTTNRWYSNIAFSPAYRNGSMPYGTFPARQCWVLSAYINLSGNYNLNTWAPHDVGVCKMGPNAAGVTMNSAVGWMGRQWNASYTRHFHVMGYPVYDYNSNPLVSGGQYLRTCIAESFQQTTEARGLGCNHGGGISGGPWIVNYAPGMTNATVDGVNSGLFVGQQNLYGARFNSSNIVVLCNAAAC